MGVEAPPCHSPRRGGAPLTTGGGTPLNTVKDLLPAEEPDPGSRSGRCLPSSRARYDQPRRAAACCFQAGIPAWGRGRGKDQRVGIRNQPLRIVVVVGLWAMWVLWTITRFTSTAIVSLPFTTTCASPGPCASPPAVAVTRQFSWSWWHFLFALIGAVLLVAASVMILRTPRSVDEI